MEGRGSLRVCGSFYWLRSCALHPSTANKSTRWRISRRSGKVEHSYCQNRRCKEQLFCRMPPTRHSQRDNERDLRLGIPLAREKYRKESTGNSTPSLVSRCRTSSLHCGEFGDSYNSVTKKTRRGYFGNRRPPASPRQWPELGAIVCKNEWPLFSWRLLHRAPERKIGCPLISRRRSHACCRRLAWPVSFDPFQYSAPD